MNSLFDW